MKTLMHEEIRKHVCCIIYNPLSILHNIQSCVLCQEESLELNFMMKLPAMTDRRFLLTLCVTLVIINTASCFHTPVNTYYEKSHILRVNYAAIKPNRRHFSQQTIKQGPCQLYAQGGNSDDEDFPWNFTGRLWFRPSLMQTDTISETIEKTMPPSVSIISLFGWTLGGVVALEYDDSPVGPYREYVSMGALVTKRGAVGQWGSRLYVSTQPAQRVCEEIWGVPAEWANIDFLERNESGGILTVETAPTMEFSKGSGWGKARQSIAVSGWEKSRVVESTNEPRYPPWGIPVLWTPTIKALWAPFIPLPSFNVNSSDLLPLHNLRLSASAIRLRFGGQQPGSKSLGIPLGIGLVVDNVLIEISEKKGDL